MLNYLSFAIVTDSSQFTLWSEPSHTIILQKYN